MGRRAKYISGDNWAVCDRCGFTYRRSQMRKEWTGLFVCARYCWEARHPQDFLRAIPEDTSAPQPIRPPQEIVSTIGYVVVGYWEQGYTNNELVDISQVNP